MDPLNGLTALRSVYAKSSFLLRKLTSIIAAMHGEAFELRSDPCTGNKKPLPGEGVLGEWSRLTDSNR